MEDLVPLKKVVHYLQLRNCAVGHRASVWPIDHPDIPLGQSGKTSIVQSFDPISGAAETRDTRLKSGWLWRLSLCIALATTILQI